MCVEIIIWSKYFKFESVYENHSIAGNPQSGHIAVVSTFTYEF